MNNAKNISRIILDMLFLLFYYYFNKFINLKTKTEKI